MAEKLDSLYVFEIYRPNGNRIADLSGLAMQREVQVVRNRAGYAGFVVDLDKLQEYLRNSKLSIDDVFAVNRNEIRVRRGTRYLFGGQINFTEARFARTKTLMVRATGFLDLFQYRYISPVYNTTQFTGVDAGQIAWELIDDTQTDYAEGDFGILQGTIDPSVTRDRTYEYANVREEIIRLSEVINGFDFEFTFDKLFNVFYPKQGVDRSELVFEYPGNIKSITVPRDGQKIFNAAFVRGQGDGVIQPIATVLKADWRPYYKLRLNLLDYPSIKDLQTLTDHGNEQVNIYHRPLELPQVTLDGSRQPFIGAYWLGDTIRLNVTGVPSYEYLKENLYRIDAIKISISEEDEEEIQLTLSLPES